jgi:hypothetical protein
MDWGTIIAALGGAVLALLGWLGLSSLKSDRERKKHAVELAKGEESKQQSEAAAAISEVVHDAERELEAAAEADRKAVEHATETETLGSFLSDRIRSSGGVREPD